MTRSDYPHPEDEFDVLGADRTPQGVHRAPVPRWRQYLPFLLVLILAPTLAFAAVRALSNDPPADPGATSSVEPATVTEEPTGVPPSEAPTEEPTEEPTTDEPTDEPTTEDPADLDRGISVFVLNGAGVGGLAGRVSETLGADGWTNVVPDDYSSQLPTSTTLYYTNADLADEAQAIAAALGISALVESADAVSNGVAIVLRPDFQE